MFYKGCTILFYLKPQSNETRFLRSLTLGRNDNNNNRVNDKNFFYPTFNSSTKQGEVFTLKRYDKTPKMRAEQGACGRCEGVYLDVNDRAHP